MSAHTVRLGRVYRFEAAHRLVSAELSDAENEAIFGKCTRPGGHGHNYELEVCVEGRPDAESGFVVDRGRLDSIVAERILDRVDHRDLNDVITEVVTTGENLVDTFYRWLAPALPPELTLARVSVRETRNNLFERSSAGETPWNR